MRIPILSTSPLSRLAISSALIALLGACGGGGVDVSEPRSQALGQPTVRSWRLIALGALPGGDSSTASSINNAGQIGGDSAITGGGGHAVAWRAGTVIDLGDLGPPGYSGFAAMNERGQIVGNSALLSAPGYHGFVWNRGIMTDLGTLGGHFSNAVAINDRGQVVGSSDTTVSSGGASSDPHAFLWERGVMTDLGTLGGAYSHATAINDRGQIVGDSQMVDGNTHAFLWENGVMIDLGTLGGADSVASAINKRGEVVGWSTTNTGEQRAFVWKRRHGRDRVGVMTDLGTMGQQVLCYAIAINARGRLMTDLGSAAWAYAINDHGQIAGVYFPNASAGDFLPSAALWTRDAER